MKISIVTPVFNGAATIEKTILSVIHQSIEAELEYIVVDGGSTDGTQEVVQRHQGAISRFVSEKDKGVYDAMNKGVGYATGDIIGIINADDWYNDGALKTVEQAFVDDPSLDILYSPIDNYLEGDYFNTFVPGALDNILIKFVINHPSCFVKKQVYERVGGFNLQYSIAADYDFMLRAYAAQSKFQYTDTVLASYSLDGMSGFSAPLSTKVKQLQESQKISSETISKSGDRALLKQQKRFYTLSYLKLFATFPFKRAKIITPRRTNAIKQFVRKTIGKPASDQYGSW